MSLFVCGGSFVDHIFTRAAGPAHNLGFQDVVAFETSSAKPGEAKRDVSRAPRGKRGVDTYNILYTAVMTMRKADMPTFTDFLFTTMYAKKTT